MEESLAGIEMELSLEEGPEYELSGMSRTLLVEASERTVDQFLGGGNRAREVVLFPQYYALLFGWALEEYLKFIGAKIKRIIGNSEDEPFYTEVYSDYEDKKNILTDGQILVTINNINVVITVSIDNARFDMLMFESREKNSKLIKEIAEGVEEYAKTNNFYRGKNLEFRGSLKMVKLKGKAWDNVVIDEEIKNEIRKNTIGFIKNLKLWEELGIPPKRGILLEGEPGTGKTIICKALMTEADCTTCISASAYSIGTRGYLNDLFELAQDLSPCLLFIEDIDLIGQDRASPGSGANPILVALLNAMDGIEEKAHILTIATTNCLEALDKALRERPSRFDRVIKIDLPDEGQRREIISRLCEKIKLDEESQILLARRTEGLTPAQIQEVLFTFVIENEEPEACRESFAVNIKTIEKTLSKIKAKNNTALGFKCLNGFSSEAGRKTQMA